MCYYCYCYAFYYLFPSQNDIMISLFFHIPCMLNNNIDFAKITRLLGTVLQPNRLKGRIQVVERDIQERRGEWGGWQGWVG